MKRCDKVCAELHEHMEVNTAKLDNEHWYECVPKLETCHKGNVTVLRNQTDNRP